MSRVISAIFRFGRPRGVTSDPASKDALLVSLKPLPLARPMPALTNVSDCRALIAACERVGACKCAEGCLECCCSERCREANQVMSKAGGEVILRSLLGLEIDVDSLPWGEDDPVGPAGIETVIVASEVRPARGKRVEVVEVKREGGGREGQRVAVGEEVGEDGEVVDERPDDVIMIKDEPED